VYTHISCDDYSACTIDDCDSNSVCTQTTICDDYNAWTDDYCDESSGFAFDTIPRN